MIVVNEKNFDAILMGVFVLFQEPHIEEIRLPEVVLFMYLYWISKLEESG